MSASIVLHQEQDSKKYTAAEIAVRIDRAPSDLRKDIVRVSEKKEGCFPIENWTRETSRTVIGNREFTEYSATADVWLSFMTHLNTPESRAVLEEFFGRVKEVVQFVTKPTQIDPILHLPVPKQRRLADARALKELGFSNEVCMAAYLPKPRKAKEPKPLEITITETPPLSEQVTPPKSSYPGPISDLDKWDLAAARHLKANSNSSYSKARNYVKELEK